MATIYHDFPVLASLSKIFGVLESAEGLSAWWSLTAAGTPGENELFELNFGPGYLWQVETTVYEPNSRIEWELVDSDSDWMNT